MDSKGVKVSKLKLLIGLLCFLVLSTISVFGVTTVMYNEQFADGGAGWETWDTSNGIGIFNETSSTNCLNDNNDMCINFDLSAGQGKRNISTKSDIDLSSCGAGSGLLGITRRAESGTLETNDCVNASFSSDSGVSYQAPSSRTTIWCDDSPSASASFSIGDSFLVSTFRMALHAETPGGFSGTSEEGWIDGINITCDIPAIPNPPTIIARDFVMINISGDNGVLNFYFRDSVSKPFNDTKINFSTAFTKAAGSVLSYSYTPVIEQVNITNSGNNGTLVRIYAIQDDPRTEYWIIWIPANQKYIQIYKSLVHRTATAESITNQNTTFGCAGSCTDTGPYWNNKTIVGGDIRGLNFQLRSSATTPNISIYMGIANYTTIDMSFADKVVTTTNFGSNIDGGYDVWRYVITPVGFGAENDKYSYPPEHDHNLTFPEKTGVMTNIFYRRDGTVTSTHTSFSNRYWKTARFAPDEWTTAGFMTGLIATYQQTEEIGYLIYSMLMMDLEIEIPEEYYEGTANAGDYRLQRIGAAMDVWQLTNLTHYLNVAKNSTSRYFNTLATHLTTNSTGCNDKVWIDGAGGYYGFIASAHYGGLNTLTKDFILNETNCQMWGLPYGLVDANGRRTNGWQPHLGLAGTWAASNDTNNPVVAMWIRGHGWIHEDWRQIAEAMALNQSIYTRYNEFVDASINVTKTLIGFKNDDGSYHHDINDSTAIRETDGVMFAVGMADMFLTKNLSREYVLQTVLDIACYAEKTTQVDGYICGANSNGLNDWMCGQSYINGAYPELMYKLGTKEVVGNNRQISALDFNKTTLFCGEPGVDFQDNRGNKLGITKNLIVYNYTTYELWVEGNQSDVRFRSYATATKDYNVSMFNASGAYLGSAYSRSNADGLVQFKLNVTKGLTRINFTDQGTGKNYNVFDEDETLITERYAPVQTDKGLAITVRANSSYSIKNLSIYINGTINQTKINPFILKYWNKLAFYADFENGFATRYPFIAEPVINNMTWINDPGLCPVGNGCVRSWNSTSKLIYAQPDNLTGQSSPSWLNLTHGTIMLVIRPQENYKDSGSNFNILWLKNNNGPSDRKVMSRWSNFLEGVYWFYGGVSVETGTMDRDLFYKNATVFITYRWCQNDTDYTGEIYINGMKYGTQAGISGKNLTNDTMDNIAFLSSEIDSWGANAIGDDLAIFSGVCFSDTEIQDAYNAYKFGYPYAGEVNVTFLTENKTAYTLNHQADSYVPDTSLGTPEEFGGGGGAPNSPPTHDNPEINGSPNNQTDANITVYPRGGSDIDGDLFYNLTVFTINDNLTDTFYLSGEENLTNFTDFKGRKPINITGFPSKLSLQNSAFGKAIYVNKSTDGTGFALEYNSSDVFNNLSFSITMRLNASSPLGGNVAGAGSTFFEYYKSATEFFIGTHYDEPGCCSPGFQVITQASAGDARKDLSPDLEGLPDKTATIGEEIHIGITVNVSPITRIGTIKFYYNGSLWLNRSDYIAINFSNVHKFQICGGNWNFGDGAGGDWNGTCDEVRISNYVKSAEQMTYEARGVYDTLAANQTDVGDKIYGTIKPVDINGLSGIAKNTTANLTIVSGVVPPVDPCAYVSGDFIVNSTFNCTFNSAITTYPNRFIIRGQYGNVTFANGALISTKTMEYEPSDFDGDFIIVRKTGAQIEVKQ